MTAIQWISKEAKVIRKKHPKLQWSECIKKASALYKAKHKVVSKPKKVGSVAKPKKTTTSKTHKDTKSHNVNIRVVSGINSSDMSLRQIKINNESIDRLTRHTLQWKEDMKHHPYNTPHWNKIYKAKIKETTDYIKTLKKQNTELKKHIK